MEPHHQKHCPNQMKFLFSTTLFFLISYSLSAQTFCVPGASSCTNASLSNVSFGGINNASGCAADGYSDYTSTVAAGNITGGTSVPITLGIAGAGYRFATIWIDNNQNGSFDTNESYYLTASNGTSITGSIAVPTAALGGLTRMRIRLRPSAYASMPCDTYATGETEDYTVNITAFVCSGAPAAGQAVTLTSSEPCAGVPFTLFMGGNYAGYQLQWESSLPGANVYTAIDGAVTQQYVMTQTTSHEYRCKVTCVASGLSAYSTPVLINTSALCYCANNNSCYSSYLITNVSFGSINNTNSCVTGGNYTSLIAPASVTAGSTLPLSVSTGQTSGSVACWIDFDHNGSFEPAEYFFVGSSNGATLTKQLFLPSNALPGLTRMRIKYRYSGALNSTDACVTDVGNGESEDYLLDVQPSPVAIYFTPFADTLYAPVLPLTAHIVQTGPGLNNTDSLKPRLWARKQGTTSWKTFAGELASGTVNDGNWVFPLNNDSLNVRRNGCDLIEFYFVAQDLGTPSNIGYLPETNALHTNVQAQVRPPSTLFSFRLVSRLKDTIYVGGNCGFSSLTKNNGLFNAINTRKLEGNLTVVVERDMNENAAVDLTAAGLNGYRLTIRPDGNTIRTFHEVDYGITMMRLKGLKNVTIDGSFNGSGRFLAFYNESYVTGYPDTLSALEIKDGCDSIAIKNVIFRKASFMPTSGPQNTVLLSGVNQNITIANCLFANMGVPVFSLRHITSKGLNKNVVIRGNEFDNFTEAGIRQLDASENWTIDSNHFYRTTIPSAYSYSWSAILVKGGGHKITRNFVGGKATFCGGTAMTFIDNPGGRISAIQVEGPAGQTPVLVSGNRVDNISMNLTYAARASSFSGISSVDNNVSITDNIVGNPQGSQYSIRPLAGSIVGIAAGGTGYAEIKNNIVTGIANTTGNTPDYYNIGMTGIGRGNSADGFTIYSDSGMISGNLIYNLRNYNNGSDGEMPFTTGISLGGGTNKLIEKNTIYNIYCNDYGVGGIKYESGKNDSKTIIRQNRIFNLINTKNNVGQIMGIAYRYVNNSIDIINNQVFLNNLNDSTGITITGIYEAGTQSVYPGSRKRILYNSIFIGGGARSDGGSYGYYINKNSNEIDTRDIFNNIFYNERAQGSVGNHIYGAGLFTLGNILNNSVADNNLYVLKDTSVFAAWGSNQSWQTWKDLYPFDDNSIIALPANISADALFVNKGFGNLNINATNAACLKIDQKGKPLAGIDYDYGATAVRSTNVADSTDIGSDEFIPAIPPPDPLVNCPGDTIRITSNITGTSYQWQVNTGTGFQNISDDLVYGGTNTSTLTVYFMPTSFYGNKYRCVVNTGISETNEVIFQNIWTGAVNNLWSNPNNWSCRQVPDGNTDVIIYNGPVRVTSNSTCRTLTINPGVSFTVVTGVTLTITH